MITVVAQDDERTFNADSWTAADDKTLIIGAGTEIVAEYAPGGWQYVLQVGSEVTDPKPPSGDT